MTKIVVYDGDLGFNKVGFTKFLRQFGYSLSAAKNITDGLLEGRPVTLEIEDGELGRIHSELEALRAKFRLDGEVN